MNNVDVDLRVMIETVRVEAKARFPVASSAMMFTARDQFKPEPQRHLIGILVRGGSVENAVPALYERMTGIPLPTNA